MCCQGFAAVLANYSVLQNCRANESSLERGFAVHILGVTILSLGVVGILISLLLLGFAAPGALGILTDVGPAENREMGIQLFSLGRPPLIGSDVECARSNGVGSEAAALRRHPQRFT